jgi:hypothetical protein
MKPTNRVKGVMHAEIVPDPKEIVTIPLGDLFQGREVAFHNPDASKGEQHPPIHYTLDNLDDQSKQFFASLLSALGMTDKHLRDYTKDVSLLFRAESDHQLILTGVKVAEKSPAATKLRTSHIRVNEDGAVDLNQLSTTGKGSAFLA